MSANLNENETKVLEAIIQNAKDCSGGDFAIGGEVAAYVNGMSSRTVAGYISSLQTKGYIRVSGPAGAVDSQITIYTNPDGTEYQQP